MGDTTGSASGVGGALGSAASNVVSATKADVAAAKADAQSAVAGVQADLKALEATVSSHKILFAIAGVIIIALGIGLAVALHHI